MNIIKKNTISINLELGSNFHILGCKKESHVAMHD